MSYVRGVHSWKIEMDAFEDEAMCGFEGIATSRPPSAGFITI
jgi:hypothetical protein